jgi:hypothetical protein
MQSALKVVSGGAAAAFLGDDGSASAQKTRRIRGLQIASLTCLVSQPVTSQ